MIPLALGRLSGLAHPGPARLLLLLWASTLLIACRPQADEHMFQGTTLGTGYHITLYANLDPQQVTEIEVGIQGELAILEGQRSHFHRAAAIAFGGFWAVLPTSLQHEVDRWFHALAVDRLTQWLEEHDLVPSAVMVEVGGVVRGVGDPPGGDWRLSLDQAGLPAPDGARHVRLKDAALVHRFVQQAPAPLVTPAAPLSVSVIAADARRAIYQASLMIHAGPEEALRLAEELDSAARVVVKTPQGIEIHHSAALEPWLEP
jgi:hypothetical protein